MRLPRDLNGSLILELQAKRDGCKIWLATYLLGEVSSQWPGMQMIQDVPA